MINIQYIKASNDVNGNPRRGWLIETPKLPVFIDEGYGGYSRVYYWLGSAYHPNCPSSHHKYCEECWVHGSSIYWNFAAVEEVKAKVSDYKMYKKFYS